MTNANTSGNDKLFTVAGADAVAGQPAERSRAEKTEWTQKTERAERERVHTLRSSVPLQTEKGSVPSGTSVRPSGKNLFTGGV
ncbi:hypothetical protein NEUTE2DRAFT_122849 [Neurospora tetrasperma FGSC 2509]|nr:hypothetical protein NEUTE2DRAFT_122849 [Neurospora tetrasperma FGSC 2509]